MIGLGRFRVGLLLLFFFARPLFFLTAFVQGINWATT